MLQEYESTSDVSYIINGSEGDVETKALRQQLDRLSEQTIEKINGTVKVWSRSMTRRDLMRLFPDMAGRV